MKILLIEDSRALRVVIERLMFRAGHKVIGVAGYRETLTDARSTLPALILLDMMLPGLDGTCVLKELEQGASTSHIQAILLTGLSQKNKTRSREAGAGAYFERSSRRLEKDPCALIQAVARVRGTSGAIQSAIGKHHASRANAGLNQSEHRVGCSRGTA